MSENEPKIIVDDDWKAQVEKEREQAAVEQPTTENDSSTELETGVESNAAKNDNMPAESSTGELPPPPPASFEVMISMLFTQAISMLGQVPDPSSGETRVNKPYAKHYIDTLEMLGEKTKGNLSDDESKMLSEAMHALRMAYVSAKA